MNRTQMPNDDSHPTDMVWNLLTHIPVRDVKLFACWCLKLLTEYVHDLRTTDVIDVAELYIRGKMPREKVDAAIKAADAAATDTVRRAHASKIETNAPWVIARSIRALMGQVTAKRAAYMTALEVLRCRANYTTFDVDWSPIVSRLTKFNEEWVTKDIMG